MTMARLRPLSPAAYGRQHAHVSLYLSYQAISTSGQPERVGGQIEQTVTAHQLAQNVACQTIEQQNGVWQQSIHSSGGI